MTVDPVKKQMSVYLFYLFFQQNNQSDFIQGWRFFVMNDLTYVSMLQSFDFWPHSRPINIRILNSSIWRETPVFYFKSRSFWAFKQVSKIGLARQNGRNHFAMAVWLKKKSRLRSNEFTNFSKPCVISFFVDISLWKLMRMQREQRNDF